MSDRDRREEQNRGKAVRRERPERKRQSRISDRDRERYRKRRRKGRRRKRTGPGIGTIVFFSFQAVIVVALIACAFVFYNRFGIRILELYHEAEKKVEASDESVFCQSQTTEVYDDEGTVINTLKGDKDVYYLKSEDIPDDVKQAFVSIEDKRFYEHRGYDLKAIFRAVVSLVRKQSITQGGSTITQQLSRNIFLSHTVRWERKVEEIFIAMQLEKKYDKDQILEYYINNIYYANGYYGIEAASRGYFGKSVSELSLSQIAFLCAIPNSPSRYDPRVSPGETIKRRDRILEEMLEDGAISETDYASAKAETITLTETRTVEASNYMQSYATNCAVRALMEKQGFTFRYEFQSDAEREAYDEEYGQVYEECQNLLVTGGYRVYTSLNEEKQALLQQAVDETLEDFVNRGTDGMYAMQGAAVCIDNETGKVVSIVGGRSQEDVTTSLNRAYQSSRQPGSTMKPLAVYTPALEGNYTADTVINDHKFEGGPENAGGVYYGNVTLRQAVEKSLNTVAWQVFEDIGVETGLMRLYELEFAKIMDADHQLSTALGGLTKGATPVEMASGYAALACEGVFRSPTCIVKITDASGNSVVDNTQPDTRQVYTSDAAHAMTNILEGVMKSGTGKALSLSGMPCAGKTGTTNDNKDGWFVGYTSYYTTAVWVGCDQVRSLNGLSGSSYPGTIWKQYMEAIHSGLSAKELND